MVEPLSFLIWMLVLLLVCYLLFWLLSQFALPQPVRVTIIVVVALVVLVYLLRQTNLLAGF